MQNKQPESGESVATSVLPDSGSDSGPDSGSAPSPLNRSSSTPLVSLTNAEARYENTPTLSGVNLSVVSGEKLALIGRSGAGKSTLLRLIYQNHSQNTALIPQHDGLVESLSVYHNVYMGRLANLPSWYNLINLIRPFSSRVAEVRQVLDRLSLQDKCFTPVASLSGGQRQRTAVARGMYQDGELLLADEPVSAVDAQQAGLILSQLSDQFPTMIVALHDTELALRYCDRIVGLKAGRIVIDAPSNTISDSVLSQLYDD